MHDHDHSENLHHHHDHHHDTTEETDAKTRNVAFLSYMVAHNKSHADELRDLQGGLSAEASQFIADAVDLFDQGNAKLESALAEMAKE